MRRSVIDLCLPFQRGSVVLGSILAAASCEQRGGVLRVASHELLHRRQRLHLHRAREAHPHPPSGGGQRRHRRQVHRLRIGISPAHQRSGLRALSEQRLLLPRQRRRFGSLLPCQYTFPTVDAG